MYQSLERTGMIDLQRLHDDTVECSVFWAKTGEGSLTMERYVQGWFRYILPEYVEESKIPWMIGMRQKLCRTTYGVRVQQTCCSHGRDCKGLSTQHNCESKIPLTIFRVHFYGKQK